MKEPIEEDDRSSAVGVPTAPDDARELASLRDRVEALRRRLDVPASEEERAPLRDALVSLVREIDATMNSLRELRESMKPLAERYKHLYPRPVPESAHQVVDHLGATTFRERGWSALAAGAYEEAVQQLRGAIDRDPAEVAAMAMLAWTYLHLDREVDAGKILERALTKDPHHPLGRTIAGLAHLRGGRLEQAVAVLRTVTEEDSTRDRTARMYAHLYLGVALTQSGRPGEGCASLREAIGLGPNLTEAFWELGRVHASEGEQDLALEAWRAGAANRFSGWGERCRAEVERVEQEMAAGSAVAREPTAGEPSAGESSADDPGPAAESAEGAAAGEPSAAKPPAEEPPADDPGPAAESADGMARQTDMVPDGGSEPS